MYFWWEWVLEILAEQPGLLLLLLQSFSLFMLTHMWLLAFNVFTQNPVATAGRGFEGLLKGNGTM
jgi:hypothetical protein